MHGETLKVFPCNRGFNKDDFHCSASVFGKLIDVQIHSSPDRNKSVGAHKVILANRSPYFHNLIGENPGCDQISLDFSYEVIVSVINLIYGEQVVVRQIDIVDFIRACSLLKLNFTVKFEKDVAATHTEAASYSGSTSGGYPSTSGSYLSRTPSSTSGGTFSSDIAE